MKVVNEISFTLFMNHPQNSHNINKPVGCPRRHISARPLIRCMGQFYIPWLVRPAAVCELNCNLVYCCAVIRRRMMCKLPANREQFEKNPWKFAFLCLADCVNVTFEVLVTNAAIKLYRSKNLTRKTVKIQC